MTRESFKKYEQIFKDWIAGDALQVSYDGGNSWNDIEDPTWSSEHEYRIHPHKFIPKQGDVILVRKDIMDNWVERVFVRKRGHDFIVIHDSVGNWSMTDGDYVFTDIYPDAKPLHKK